MFMSGKIEVIGLGAGGLEQLSVGIYRKLMSHHTNLFLRTEAHPVIAELKEENLTFKSFDHIYEKHEQFDDVYEEIVETLLKEAQDQHLIYAVPGHPMLAEKTVQLLLQQTTIQIEIVGGQSYLDDLFTAIQIDPIDGFQFIDATAFTQDELNYRNAIIFCQVYDAFIASEVKLTLLEDLPPNYEIVIVEAAGSLQENITKIPLVELDRIVELSNLTSVYIPPASTELLTHEFATFRDTVRTLRGEHGCAWDKRQTHESLRQYAIEEVYELIDAINTEDDAGIIEELGDVLLQVMLHSQIGEDAGYFTINDVIQGIHHKMVHRHPHVFGGDTSKTWEQLKQEEKPQNDDALLLDHVLTTGPSLQVAYKLQQKVSKVGFDWEAVEDIWEKFTEEKQEFIEALEDENERAMEEEFGDMLFVLANIAKYYNINPELALRKANTKFITRFNEVEQQVQQAGKQLKDTPFAELDYYWDKAKEKESE